MAYDTFAEGRDLWGPGTAPYFAPLDAAGYNYKTVRAAYDGEKFPQRVIYGAESYPRAAFQSWQAVVDNANTIGDFVWTACDYLGEVGVGRWEVSGQPRPSDPAWPWMSGYCGDFDLTGRKRPQSWYRDVLWGVSRGPKLLCLPPELTGKPIAYHPGTLEAVGYRDGVETGRDTLTTAGCAVRLELSADRDAILADGRDLCFVDIQAVDGAGRPVLDEVGPVMVSVDGGELLPASAEAGRYVEEPRRGGPEERTLGELMDDPRTLAVLKAALGPMLDSPMLADMKGLSLKKLLTMGGQALAPELIGALDATWTGGQPC